MINRKGTTAHKVVFAMYSYLQNVKKPWKRNIFKGSDHSLMKFLINVLITPNAENTSLSSHLSVTCHLPINFDGILLLHFF